MLFMQSMLLWVLAGCALIMIMHYVLKSPRTPERPEFGLGKRYRVGGRGVKRRASSRIDDEFDFAPESTNESAIQSSAPYRIPAQAQQQNEAPAQNHGRVASRAPAENPKLQHQAPAPVLVLVPAQVPAPAPAPARAPVPTPTPAPAQNPMNVDPGASTDEAAMQKPKRRTVTMQNMLNKAMSDRR